MQPASASIERYDNEYERRGSCALFMLFQPLLGQREVIVRSRRTALDYAAVVRYLCEKVHPRAEKIVLVQDNLNTHGLWSLYQAFEPEQARALVERIEWHSTSSARFLAQHGRNRAFGSGTPILERTDGKPEFLAEQVAHWQQRRNAASVRVDWRFEIQEARCKLKRLYPEILHG